MGDDITLLTRTVGDILSGGTLGIALEKRNIVVAQGIQFTNADQAVFPDIVIPNGLTAPKAERAKWAMSMRNRAPLKVTTTDSGFEYWSFVQGVRFVVDIVTTKDAFR